MRDGRSHRPNQLLRPTILPGGSRLTCGSDSAEADDTAEAAAADGAGACAAHEPLCFSDTGVEGLETLVLEFEDFRVALEEVTGLDVEFQPMSRRTAAATALEYDDLDVLLTGPAEYVVLKAEADAIPLVGVTRDNYKAWHLSVRCGFGPRLLRPKLRW